MSAVDAGAQVRQPTLVPGAFVPLSGRPAISTRFLRSELKLIFGRRRNIAGFAVLAAVPIIIGVAVYLAKPSPGNGPPFFSSITSNGLFVALTALTVELPLFLPLAVASISGDTIAGEANLGTLRYLLAVPVHRTRLLGVKFLAVAIFTLFSTLLVAAAGAAIGLALFGAGPATLLNGAQIGIGDAAWRLLLVSLYISASLLALGAIGIFVSTLTEQPIGATIAVVSIAVASQIIDTVPQLHAIHPYLFTHYWLAYGDLMRDPVSTDLITKGLITSAIYVVVFWTLSWARFAGKDVSS